MKPVPLSAVETSGLKDKDLEDARAMVRRLSRSTGKMEQQIIGESGIKVSFNSKHPSKSRVPGQSGGLRHQSISPEAREIPKLWTPKRLMSAHVISGTREEEWKQARESRRESPYETNPNSMRGLSPRRTITPGSRPSTGAGRLSQELDMTVEASRPSVMLPGVGFSTPRLQDENMRQHDESTKFWDTDAHLRHLMNNIFEVRESMGGRLEQHPDCKKDLDYDLKELQLHLDRLVLHASSEKERANAAMDALRRDYLIKMRRMKDDYDAQLKERGRDIAELREECMLTTKVQYRPKARQFSFLPEEQTNSQFTRLLSILRLPRKGRPIQQQDVAQQNFTG